MTDVVKEGYAKVKSKNLGKWNKRWLVLRRPPARGGGSVKLEKYENEASAGHQASAHCAVYDLAHLHIVRQSYEGNKNVVCLTFDDYTTVNFATDTKTEADNWVQKIQQTIDGVDATGHSDTYEVYLMQSANLPSSGECLLQVTADSIQLLDIDDPRRVELSWPLSAVRRYSVERGMFSLEAGRKCTTGEGIFMFDTKDADAIFEKVQRVSQAMKSNHQRSDDD